MQGPRNVLWSHVRVNVILLLAPTLKPAVPNSVSHGCLCVMTIPATESTNLLRNTETTPTPRLHLLPRGYCPRLNSSYITRLGLPNNLLNQALSFSLSHSRRSRKRGFYCRPAEVWPCLCRDKSSYSPRHFLCTQITAKEGLNDFGQFHHYFCGCSIPTAPIHFHNFNIAGIYRLGDLISPRIFITWFLSDIYLCNIVFSREELQKGHLLVFWKNEQRRRERGFITWKWCVLHLYTLYCTYRADECMLLTVLFLPNWLWFRWKTSSHRANYLTVHRPFTYPASC